MKHLVILAGVMSMLALSPSASADGRYWGSYDRFFEIGFSNRDYVRGPRGFRGQGFGYGRHFNRRYNRHYQPYVRPYGGFRRYRRDRFDSGALLGGLILGSVIGHTVAASRYDRPVTVAPANSRVRVIRRTPVSSTVRQSQRRLLRDLEGRCYEITRTTSGSEIRTELDPSACNF